MTKKILLIQLLFIVFSLNISANEGMYIMPNIPDSILSILEKQGSELERNNIYSEKDSSLKDNILYLSNGYTATIISKNGLIITNYKALEPLLINNKEIKDNGFYAKEQLEEIAIKNLSALQLVSTQNVSRRIESEFKNIYNVDKKRHIADSISTIICQELVLPESYIAKVETTTNNEYYLYVYKRHADIRLSLAPAYNIAFVNKTNNDFLKNRNNADFVILRVYASPENEPSQYHEINSAVKFNNCAKISVREYKNTDFVMAMGYPNQTYRNKTSSELTDYYFTKDSAFFKAAEFLDTCGYKSFAEEIIEINNKHKFINSSNLISIKEKEEFEFSKWAANDSVFKRVLRYANTTNIIKKYYKLRNDDIEKYRFMHTLFSNIELINAGNLFLDINDDNAKILFKELSLFYENYDAEKEQLIINEALNYYKNLNDSTIQLGIFKIIDTKFKGKIDKFLKFMFKSSFLTDEMRLNKYLDEPSPEKYKADLLLLLCKDIRATTNMLYQRAHRYDNVIKYFSNIYAEGKKLQSKTNEFAPDANYTMRIAFGEICKYTPYKGINIDEKFYTDAIFNSSLLDNDNYIVDSLLLDLRPEVDSICNTFTTNCDLPTGRMGEAIFNIHGDLLGICTDGYKENYFNQYFYNAEAQRNIVLDMQYVLFLLREIWGAENILSELEYGEQQEQEVKLEYINTPINNIVFSNDSMALSNIYLPGDSISILLNDSLNALSNDSVKLNNDSTIKINTDSITIQKDSIHSNMNDTLPTKPTNTVNNDSVLFINDTLQIQLFKDSVAIISNN